MLDGFPKSLEVLCHEGGQLGMLTMEQVVALQQLEANYFPAPGQTDVATGEGPSDGSSVPS